MSQKLQSLEAFLEEVGCPYEAGSTDSVIWVDGYCSGVAKAGQVATGEVEVETGDNVVRFIPRCR
jgi:hypothetical protein